jgi:hypothetical protein
MTGIQPQVTRLSQGLTTFSGIPIRIDPDNFDRPAPKIALSIRLFSPVMETSVSDSDPDWIRIQEGKDQKNLEKVNKFHFLKFSMFSFEG